jgi:hypothetical protein
MSLPVTFRTAENYRTESVIFDVAEVNLPFNDIISRPALQQFMAVARYGYLVPYLVFMPKPSTHRMHDTGSLVPHIRSKVLTDNQKS